MKKWIVTLVVLVSFGISYSQTSEKGSHLDLRDLTKATAIVREGRQNEIKSQNQIIPQNDDRSLKDIKTPNGVKTSNGISTPNSNKLITEDFSQEVFPPTGWTIDKRQGNWMRYNSSFAGGTAPEAFFYYSPVFEDTSRLISPKINTQGKSTLILQFKQSVSYYKSSLIIGVATRSKGNAWTSIISTSVRYSISGEEALVFISNSDVGQTDFQFCFYFQGNSDNLNYWCIDDISLSEALEHDISIASVNSYDQFKSGFSYSAGANVINYGKSTESFDVECRISDYLGNVLFTNTKTLRDIPMGITAFVDFDPYVLADNNSLYKIDVEAKLTGDQNAENNSKSKYINTYTTVRDLVLLEIGTGTWCTYCPGASMGADDLLRNGKKVGVVKYHSGDEFENDESVSRINYYGITGFPTAIFDGTEYFIGGAHSESMYPGYLSLYNVQNEVKTPLSVGIYGSQLNSTIYNLSIEIKKLAPIITTGTKLFTALTESDIDFAWQDQTKVNFAERLLLPNDAGAEVDLTNKDTQTIPLTFALQSKWNASNLELIAWVQDVKSRKVLNCSKVMLSSLQAPVGVAIMKNSLPSEFKLDQNYPNPFNPETRISYSVPKQGLVTIKLYDITGQEAGTLVNEIKEAGTYNVEFNAGKLSSGIYLYRMLAEGFIQVKKMCVLK